MDYSKGIIYAVKNFVKYMYTINPKINYFRMYKNLKKYAYKGVIDAYYKYSHFNDNMWQMPCDINIKYVERITIYEVKTVVSFTLINKKNSFENIKMLELKMNKGKENWKVAKCKDIS